MEIGPLRAWHLEAVCVGHPEHTDWSFSEDPELVAKAVTICLHCPVRLVCGQEADARGETWGVWGGRPRHRVRGFAKVG